MQPSRATDLDWGALADKIGNRIWRLNNLYYVQDKAGNEVQFRLNRAQRRLLKRLHHRNVILKARQLGYSTFILLFGLDVCLFNSGQSLGVIAHTLDDAEDLFRNKIKFALDRLPAPLQTRLAPKQNSARKLEFPNDSSVTVGTSLRGGTYQIVHISEYGKISARYPDKALEIKTGALETVPADGVVFIESTAEGREGEFYRLVQGARRLADQGETLGPLDYRFHFSAWWEESGYRADPKLAVIHPSLQDYFRTLEIDHGITLDDEQKAWYALKRDGRSGDGLGDEMMKREYPSCVAQGQTVSTTNGLEPIESATVDGTTIIDRFYKGEREVFEVTTNLGYRVTCTHDHLIKMPSGEFERLENLESGSEIQLAPVVFGNKERCIDYQVVPFQESSIPITERLALFVGFFIGDGSYHKDTVSIVCDASDPDTVEAVKGLFDELLGGSGDRVVGSKKGGTEIRVSAKEFKPHFLALGLLRQNGSYQYKRDVQVPEWIKTSPAPVVKEFLRGLFEADGFAQRNGTGVKFFSKYRHLASDVQMLLLGFGITSRLSRHDKKASSGNTYEGFELTLRTEEARLFTQTIGFVSERKQKRCLSAPAIDSAHSTRRKKVVFQDKIQGIVSAGTSPVYDMTTASHEYMAGGIVVHNCPDEAFEVAIQGAYYAKQFQELRRNKQITRVPHTSGLPVITAWDLGMSDSMVIWFAQVRGREVRLIDYHEGSGEGLAHYARVLREKAEQHGYQYVRHLAPHDIEVRDLSANGESRWDIALENGIRFDVVKAVPSNRVADAIEPVRQFLPMCYFDADACADGIKALEHYRREWDERRGTYRDQPVHDWASHASKAFEMLVRGDVFGSRQIHVAPVSRPNPRGWT